MEKPLRILILGDEGVIPSTYIRLTGVLRRLECELTCLRPYDAGLDAIETADVVIFQRCFSNKALLLFYTASLLGKPTICDLDDYLIDLPETCSLRLPREQVENIKLIVAQCGAATCSTAALREKLVAINGGVRLIPNRVQPNGKTRRPGSETIRFLISNTDYFKLTQSSEAFIDALERALNEHPVAKLVVFGSSHEGLRALRSRHKGQVEIVEKFIPDYEKYIETVKGMEIDFALAPLECTKFHAFKSNIKYLDYGSLGIPGIFSKAPCYDCVVDRKTGLLTENTAKGWHESISELLQDPALRCELGENAYKDVEANHNILESVRQWREVLSEVCAEGVKPIDGPLFERLSNAVNYDASGSVLGIRELSRRLAKRISTKLRLPLSIFR